MTARLTATEHADVAAALLATLYEEPDAEARAEAIAAGQVHATLALIPDAGAVPARPAPAPARVPKVLTFEDIGGDEWSLEAGNDGATVVLTDYDGSAPLILDDPEILDRLAQALTHHARRIRDEHPPRKDPL